MNRHFGVTLLALWVGAELFLRLVPSGPAPLFRALYGNSLAMFMTVHERLGAAAGDVRVLALGDSLAMTQFQPELFAEAAGLQPGAVFNAAYLGMSFPSQADLLRSIGLDRFERLEHVLYFVNPRRLSASEVPNTDVLRLGVPPAEGALAVAWETKRVGPLLDRSRLYGLSRYLVFSAWRSWLADAPLWDHVEWLGPHGGVAWPHPRANGATPRYPYPPLDAVSQLRRDEMRRVLSLLRESGARVTLVPSALHPAAAPFASDDARRLYEEELARLAAETGAVWRPEAVADFAPPDERDFCDYGHMNDAGGRAYTQHLLRSRALLDGR